MEEEKKTCVEKNVTHIHLYIVKRRVPLKTNKIRFIEQDKKIKMDPIIAQINGFVYFYKNFETSFEIKAGDVFVARLPIYQGVGNELTDNHLFVALLDSRPNNPLIRVVPLTSGDDKHGIPNPASDVKIGKIEGMLNEKESLAVINQTRTIDKRRLFSGEVIKSLSKIIVEGKDYERINVQTKRIYRLSPYQLERIRRSVLEYDLNGYISHID